MVETFKCPDLPSSSFKTNKRRFKVQDESADNNLKKKERLEFNEYFNEVKNYAKSSSGKKEDVLTKLGLPPPKQQKMPFKMRLGINQGRKKREEKILNSAKESNLILAKTAYKKTKIKTSSADKGLEDDVKGGVLYISKKMLNKNNFQK